MAGRDVDQALSKHYGHQAPQEKGLAFVGKQGFNALVGRGYVTGSYSSRRYCVATYVVRASSDQADDSRVFQRARLTVLKTVETTIRWLIPSVYTQCSICKAFIVELLSLEI